MQRLRGVFGAIHDLTRASPAFRMGGAILFVLLVMALASFVAPYGPTDRRVVPIDRPPSLLYPLGTTSLGQDVLWLTTYAIRNSLIIAGIAVLISRTLAVLMGSISGYIGGGVDRVLSAFTDSFIVIPRLPLLILISFMIRGTLNMVQLAVLIGLLTGHGRRNATARKCSACARKNSRRPPPSPAWAPSRQSPANTCRS